MRVGLDWRSLLGRRRPPKTVEERHRIQARILESSTPRGAFYLLVVLSTTIAAFGLLANSAAVVIGAMLVAPLMGPIFGIALSLANGSRRLLARAALSETAGVVLSVALAALIGALAVYPSFGPEIVGRTRPTLYDVLVALASGVAGAYALVDEKISPALPGVAIATALVPPLSTCGLCLAAGQWDWALGAFLLFFANFLAIEVAAAVVFLLAGMGRGGPDQGLTLRVLLRRFGLSIALLAGVAAFMTHTLVGLVSESRFSEGLKRALSAEVRSSVGAHLTDVQFRRERRGTEVIAVVLTPQEFAPDQVARIEEHLRSRLDPGIHLVIRSLLSKDEDRTGPVFVAPEDRRRRADAVAQTALLASVSERMKQELGAVPGASLADLRLERGDGGFRVATIVRTPEAIGPETVARIEGALATQLGKPLRLTVRSVLTRDADATRYLYGAQETAPPTEAEKELASAIEGSLGTHLTRLGIGASLLEVRTQRKGARLLVSATVQARSLLSPARVRRLERTLRRAVAPNIDLVVKSSVGAEVSPRGYAKSS